MEDTPSREVGTGAWTALRCMGTGVLVASFRGMGRCHSTEWR